MFLFYQCAYSLLAAIFVGTVRQLLVGWRVWGCVCDNRWHSAILYYILVSDFFSTHSYLQELMEVWQKRPSSAKQKSKHSFRCVDVEWTLTVILRIIVNISSRRRDTNMHVTD